MWTLDYAEDIESDLSAIHRIDDPMTISGPRYFMLALRLTAYTGVMQARAEKVRQDERQDEREGVSEAHTAAHAAPSGNAGRTKVSDDVAIAQLSDGWIDHVTEGRE